MITKNSLKELKDLIEANPHKTCYEFAEGMMFATRDGDTSCLTGATQKSGEEVVDGQTFTIYVGGAIKK